MRGEEMAKNNLPKGITKRPDGRYCIRIMRDGQKVTKYAKTRKEAETILREITYEMEHGTYRKDTKLTCDQWFETWIDTYKKPSIKESTIAEYQCYYKVHIKPMIGKMRLQSVKASHIQKILNGMQENGYSEKVMHHVFVVVNGMMQQAVKEQLILFNPADGVTVPKGKPQESHIAMTVQEQKLFTDHIQDGNQILDSFLQFQLCTGLRFGECAALRWQDIDLKNKVVHVRHTVHTVDGVDVLTSPKTKSSLRTVPLIPQAIEVLRRERARTAGQKVIALDRYVFDGGDGRAVTLQTLNRYMKRICKEIRQEGIEGFPTLTSHCLRHSFATRALENGMPPQTLKSILGHSSLAMTVDLYSHVMPDQKQAGMELIAGAF